MSPHALQPLRPPLGKLRLLSHLFLLLCPWADDKVMQLESSPLTEVRFGEETGTKEAMSPRPIQGCQLLDRSKKVSRIKVALPAPSI